jgi:hypothetical protein
MDQFSPFGLEIFIFVFKKSSDILKLMYKTKKNEEKKYLMSSSTAHAFYDTTRPNICGSLSYYQPNTLAGAINNFFMVYPQKYINCSTLDSLPSACLVLDTRRHGAFELSACHPQ